MNKILLDIKTKIQNNEYQNEEQVRFSLVGRVIQELGWDIWNPKEVKTEFKPVPNEDSTKVDIALFNSPFESSVFIEIKAVGKLMGKLEAVEQQLRDYNRNHTATFSIITDGQHWRFYYSQTAGEFSNKCYKVIDFLKDDIESIEEEFKLFLAKETIASGRAKLEAESYLKLTRKQRLMEDAYPEAIKQTGVNPFPSLPQALINVVNALGLRINNEEAIKFLKKRSDSTTPIKPKQTFTAKEISPIKITTDNDNITLYLNLLGGEIKAKGIFNNRKMTILEGSEARFESQPSIPQSAERTKKELIQQNILIQRDNKWIFTQNYEFSSANQAASVVAGISIQATKFWKNENGLSINDLGLRT